MKRILVPTDFSPNAEKALQYAVQLAKKTQGEVIIVHAVESAMMEGEVVKVTEKMNKESNSIAAAEKINITCRVYEGLPVNIMLHAIQECNADLVVMGTLGNTALKEKILGSRTASLIGKSPVPVLAIPLQSAWKVPGKILLAINRFDEKETQLLPVIKLARLFNASIQVTIFTDTDDDFVEDYDEHEEKIASFRDILKLQYKDVEIHAVHLAGHHFRPSLEHWIDTNDIDVLVMLPHRKMSIEKIFTGSQTKKMAHHTHIPLLAIPV